MVRRYQAKFAKTVPEHFKFCHIKDVGPAVRAIKITAITQTGNEIKGILFIKRPVHKKTTIIFIGETVPKTRISFLRNKTLPKSETCQMQNINNKSAVIMSDSNLIFI